MGGREYLESFSINFVLKYHLAHGMTMTTKFIFLSVAKKGGGGEFEEGGEGWGGRLFGEEGFIKGSFIE